MCKKYINSTLSFFKSITMENQKILALNAPIDVVPIIEKNNKSYIDEFIILIQTNILENSKQINNPITDDEQLDFIVRLTKCSKNKNERLGYDLNKFTINIKELKDNNMLDKACFRFYNETRSITVSDIPLDVEEGDFVIKLLVKGKNDDDYSIQSMRKIRICK